MVSQEVSCNSLLVISHLDRLARSAVPLGLCVQICCESLDLTLNFFGLSELWDSPAYAGLLSLFGEEIGPMVGVLKSIARMLPQKGWSFPSRAAPVSLVARHGRVLARSRFRTPAGSKRAREYALQQVEFSEMQFEEVLDFPETCAEMLSVDACTNL